MMVPSTKKRKKREQGRLIEKKKHPIGGGKIVTIPKGKRFRFLKSSWLPYAFLGKKEKVFVYAKWNGRKPYGDLE